MMFFSEKPEKVGPKVAGKLAKELALPTPPSYEAEVEGQFRPGSIGQALGDMSKYLFGGRTRPLLTLRLDLPQPRPFELRAHVIKAGSAVALGSLLYSIRLNRPVAAPVELEAAKTFSKSRFVGDGVAERLNADAALIKKVNRFVRTEYRVGEEIIKTERFLKIVPFEGGSLLSVNTLPKSKWMGLSSTFEAKPFLDIAATIEALL